MLCNCDQFVESGPIHRVVLLIEKHERIYLIKVTGLTGAYLINLLCLHKLFRCLIRCNKLFKTYKLT